MLTDLLTNSIFPLNIGQHFDVSGNISQHRHNVDWFHLSLAIVLTNSVFPVNIGQHFDVSVNISQNDYSTQSSFSLTQSINIRTYCLPVLLACGRVPIAKVKLRVQKMKPQHFDVSVNIIQNDYLDGSKIGRLVKTASLCSGCPGVRISVLKWK
jgi:hypothetical protein